MQTKVYIVCFISFAMLIKTLKFEHFFFGILFAILNEQNIAISVIRFLNVPMYKRTLRHFSERKEKRGKKNGKKPKRNPRKIAAKNGRRGI